MRNVRRYTVLGTAGARLISTDRIEVAVLAMYKYARPTMKWKDMIQSAKTFSNATKIPNEICVNGYFVVDNEKEPREGQRWSDATARSCLESRIKKANETIQTALIEITYCETKLTEMEKRYV